MTNMKIAILRGINVGGKRKILMADLKLLFENLGHSNVKTYIQSGNVIFNTDNQEDNIKVANEIEEAISNKFGFEVPVIIRTNKELAQSVKQNPFYQNEETDISHLHLIFLKEKPSEENLKKVLTFNYEPDKLSIKSQDVFIYCEGKYHKSKLTNNFFEKKLNVAATTRNWKTVLKLLALSQG